MHGMIMDMLQRFVIDTYDRDTWKQLLANAGVKNKIYYPIMDYSDAETVQLVVTASEMTGLDVQTILGVFGEYIADDLLQMSAILLKPDWQTLDFLENVEEIIHRLIRSAWKAHPPVLNFQRTAPNQITLRYTSQRKMCSVAKGIVRGVAKHYNQPLTVREDMCMLQGAHECLIHFRT